MTVALIANGELSPSLKPAIERHSHIIAIDGGLVHCHRLSITPDLIVGDFDSCPVDTLHHYTSVPKISLPTDKDQTDLEVGLEEAFKIGTRVVLYGAWGGRVDHSLTNVLILLRYPGRLHLETENEILFAIEKETHLDTFIGQTISLIPIGGAALGITTSGLKWELKNGKLDQNFIGISNVCLQKRISIHISSGQLLCCLLKAERL